MPKEVDPKKYDKGCGVCALDESAQSNGHFFKTFDVTNLIKVSRKKKLEI